MNHLESAEKRLLTAKTRVLMALRDYDNAREALGSSIELLHKVKRAWYNHGLPQPVYQKFKAGSTEQRKQLETEMLGRKLAVRDAYSERYAAMQEVSSLTELAIAEQAEKEKNSLVQQGAAMLVGLTEREKAALAEYFKALSFARVN